MATILFTGVTGTVGSSLAPLLKAKGHQLIYLVRSKGGKNSAIRLKEALGQAAGNDFVLDGDITLPQLGISSSERREWKGKIDKVVHCASSIKFNEALTRETTQVNVYGTNNVLDLARELRIPEVHHISTAYVAGNADYFSENDFDVGQTCRNVYERTKKEAEGLVRNWRYGRYSIYRLGIVVGDSITGYTPSFNGYYGFAGTLWYLKQSLIQKTTNELAVYKKEGIDFDQDGMLVLPIYLNFSATSTLNIVSLDWVAETLSELIGIPAGRKVFHIVHPRPPKARWVNNVSLKHLGIKGFYYGNFADYSAKSLPGRLQKVFNRSTLQYLPYITHECKFEVANVPYTLGEKYRLPPEIDEMFIVTLLDYAKSADFGRKKPVPLPSS